MEKIWIDNIYKMIKYYSDINVLSAAWYGFNRENASSFDEDISLLFDSFSFDDFLRELQQDDNINKDLLDHLVEFRDLLSSYQKPSSGLVLDILNDCNWLMIVRKAKQITDRWNFPARADF